jgi:hypothetical protein
MSVLLMHVHGHPPRDPREQQSASQLRAVAVVALARCNDREFAVHVIVLETLQQLLLAVDHGQPRCADDVRGHRPPSTSSFSDGALLDDVLTVLGDVFQSRRLLRYELVVVWWWRWW